MREPGSGEIETTRKNLCISALSPPEKGPDSRPLVHEVSKQKSVCTEALGTGRIAISVARAERFGKTKSCGQQMCGADWKNPFLPSGVAMYTSHHHDEKRKAPPDRLCSVYTEHRDGRAMLPGIL